jgi:hypothetical protein
VHIKTKFLVLSVGGLQEKQAVQRGIWLPTQYLLWDQEKPRKTDVEVEVTSRLTVCLAIEQHCGTCDQILFDVGMLLSKICDLVSTRRPIWPEVRSAKSLRNRNHTLLSYVRLSQPGGSYSRIYIPKEQGSPLTLPGIGIPLRRLSRLTGLRWRYFNPLPTWGGQVSVYIAFRSRTVQSK